MSTNVIAQLRKFLQTEENVGSTLDVDRIMQRAIEKSPDGARLCDNIYSILEDTALARKFLKEVGHPQACAC